jgi:replication-associated recombination protein RarA
MVRDIIKNMVFDEFIKKGIDNLRFALNLDDYVPEHIRQELMVRQMECKNYKSLQVTNELVPDEMDDFNAKVDQLFHRSENISKTKSEEEGLFDSIIGYEDIKKLFIRCIQSNEPIHIILDGAPASAKSMFLLSMKDGLEKTYFVDATNASGPGMVEYLFKNNVKYLLIDECEKMSKSDQNVLLNLLETGILASTKVKKTAEKKMKVWVFATTNDIDAISKPFRSRFIEFSLPSYTFEEFCDIAVKLTEQRDGHDRETAMKIADTVWNKLGSGDVRDIIQISRLTKSIDDVEFLASTLQKYKRKIEREGQDVG